MKTKTDTRVYVVLDVNLNRLKEALRVVEDALRFGVSMSVPSLLQNVKELRHDVTQGIECYVSDEEQVLWLEARDITQDALALEYTKTEAKRDDILQVLQANLARAKESLRSLEEFSKLVSSDLGRYFQELRFRLYDLEKKILLDQIKKKDIPL